MYLINNVIIIFRIFFKMPSTVLFSNVSFGESAQSTVLRSIESAKQKVQENDIVQLYLSCSKDLDKIEKKEPLINSNKSILESVDNYVDHNTINTIFESQPLKIDVTSDLKPLAKKRKLKIIPNKIEVAKTEDAKHKTVALMTKVSLYFYVYIENIRLYISIFIEIN